MPITLIAEGRLLGFGCPDNQAGLSAIGGVEEERVPPARRNPLLPRQHRTRNNMISEEKKMKETLNKVKAFVEDEGGATAVEYGIMIAAIAAVIIAVVVSIGTKINSSFTKVQGNIPT
jgi:pilus assembly protein Flp/PilA